MNNYYEKDTLYNNNYHPGGDLCSRADDDLLCNAIKIAGQQ